MTDNEIEILKNELEHEKTCRLVVRWDKLPTLLKKKKLHYNCIMLKIDKQPFDNFFRIVDTIVILNQIDKSRNQINLLRTPYKL